MMSFACVALEKRSVVIPWSSELGDSYTSRNEELVYEAQFGKEQGVCKPRTAAYT